MKKVKYNFKKIQEGMINNYGFVELPLQKVGTAKSNEHDEFVARLSEYKMDPEKVFQAGSGSHPYVSDYMNSHEVDPNTDVGNAFIGILDNNYLEDRLEYDAEDMMSSYGLSPEGGQKLFDMVKGYGESFNDWSMLNPGVSADIPGLGDSYEPDLGDEEAF